MKRNILLTARTKTRIASAFLALIMLLCFAPRALAASGHGNGNSGKDGTKTEQKDKKKKTETEEMAQSKEKKQYKGISVEKISLAIDSVSDEAAKAELTSLLDAYMTVLEDKDAALDTKTGSLSELSQLASDARKALKDGLEEAGFTLGSILGWQEWKEWPADTALDLEQVASLIGALDDADANKQVLSGLLTAYQEALAAQTGAEDEALLDQLKEATQAAREALLEALYAAGLLPLAEEVPETADPLEGAVEN